MTLAEAAGEGGPQGMQRLLNFYAWDAEEIRDDVRAAVVEALGDAERGVLIVDETGFVNKGSFGHRRAHVVVADLAETDWRRVGCGNGAHAQRLYDWAAVENRPWRAPATTKSAAAFLIITRGATKKRAR